MVRRVNRFYELGIAVFPSASLGGPNMGSGGKKTRIACEWECQRTGWPSTDVRWGKLAALAVESRRADPTARAGVPDTTLRRPLVDPDPDSRRSLQPSATRSFSHPAPSLSHLKRRAESSTWRKLRGATAEFESYPLLGTRYRSLSAASWPPWAGVSVWRWSPDRRSNGRMRKGHSLVRQGGDSSALTVAKRVCLL